MRSAICNLNLFMTLGNLTDTRTVPSRRLVQLLQSDNFLQRITLATNIYGEMCWCFNLEDLYFFLWLSQYFNLLKYFIKNLMLYVLLTPRSATSTTVDRHHRQKLKNEGYQVVGKLFSRSFLCHCIFLISVYPYITLLFPSSV